MRTALFSGDWEWSDTLDCYKVAFQGIDDGRRWNGFARPLVTRRVMEAVALRQQMLRLVDPTSGYDTIVADGNGFQVFNVDEREAHGDEAITWLLPDADDRFDLGKIGYCWNWLDEDDRVIERVFSSVG